MVTVYYGTKAEESVKALLKVIQPFDGLSSASKVVIKPNLVVARKNYLGVDTRPEVVKALVRDLIDHGVRDITVADGSGVGHRASDAFRIMGYEQMIGKYGIKLMDIEKDRFITLPVQMEGPFRTLEIARTVAECDFLINVPVLKAHSQTKLTCSLKNMKGVMPGPMKPRFHTVDLHRAIAQLNSLIKHDFILADGAFGDLSSELGGTPVELGIMAAGFDPLEIDAFAAGVLGFRPEEILHLGHYARWRGVDPAGFQPEVRRLNKPAETKSFTVDTDPFSRYPCGVISEGVCCTCRANLAFALRRLWESGDLRKSQYFLNGRRGIDAFPPGSDKNLLLAVGNCAAAQLSGLAGDKSTRRVVRIEGCPPSAEAIIGAVKMSL